MLTGYVNTVSKREQGRKENKGEKLAVKTLKILLGRRVWAHTQNPSIWESEAGQDIQARVEHTRPPGKEVC